MKVYCTACYDAQCPVIYCNNSYNIINYHMSVEIRDDGFCGKGVGETQR